MKIYSLIFIAFLMAFVIQACSEDEITEIKVYESDNVIIPLAVNNTWIRKVSFTDSPNQFAYDTVSVVKDTVINNEKTFLWLNRHISGIDPRYVKNSDDGLLEFTTYPNYHFQVLLKYPAYKGESYLHYDHEIKVVSINDTVTVPAGIFYCYHYNMTVIHYWYCPGIGIVKEDNYIYEPTVTTIDTLVKKCTYELVEYHLQ